MSSIPGLPTPGSDVTILITRVNLSPHCVLVELWGNFSQEKKADYQYLAKDIQSPGKVFHEFEGNPGDQCLVQVDYTWYRSHIVSRNGSNYSVFLIDKGWTHSATTSMLAWGKKEYFYLPPEVEFCVLANVLPLSPENYWSPVALEFLKSLCGKSVKACVQDVLVPHRTFILHIPCISKQMYEMGFAKKLSAESFKDFVFGSLQSHSGAAVSPETQQNSMRNEPVGSGERMHKQQLFMYPELPTGTVETVIITEVTNPQRVFCQLKVFSQELKKLTEQITQHYEGRLATCIVSPDMLGSPCAARGSDGRWYRSVLQQVFPTNKVVEVLNVDYGTKQFVQVEHVRPLAAEFFRMPVVTYICSLHGITDKGVGWTATHIDYLKTLLLYKTVIAKFEYQSLSEGVHYVTLYGDENTNINNLFGSKDRCLLECEKSLGDYAVHSTKYRGQHQVRQESQGSILTSAQAVKGTEGKKLPVEDLPLNSSHMAVVQHVSSPSEFWIQTQKYANEFDKLMGSIFDLYRDSVNEDVVRNPTVGLYCAAKAEDGDFYRATVSEVGETQIKMFFVDYGNTEVIDRSSIRTLPDKLKKLPHLALKCRLAAVKPKDERWSQSATDFFTKAVTDKVLNVHVTAKYDGAYVVHMTDSAAHGERNVSKMMCSSGFAEKDEAQKQPKAKMTMRPAILPAALNPGAKPSEICRNSGISFQIQNTVGPTSNESRNTTFKEHMFPIGSALDVIVSYTESPNDFWCQLVQNAGHLKLLMQDMQTHYASSQFQPFVETDCVARHPDNGMWYRALIIHKHVTPHADVLFVDYGQMKTVSLYDLRRICPAFLNLKGQAFRCSLYNPVDPTSTMNDWGEEAMALFQEFVDAATSNHVILKCTIYAVMYNEQKVVFNIVDLETPFESVCTHMVNLVNSTPPKKASGSSVRLNTYYYSTHNIKTGTEEMVTVTCVNGVNQFYCQLQRNADVVEDLMVKLSNLCRHLKNAKLPTVFGTVCFAKYTDGQWYRGRIKATQPSILVHFVDYGDTLEVDKSDLLPVPREASDIMSVPVQAVECSLSDIPANVPSEVNSWFESHATERTFRALVVAKEPDGKLLVELYYGSTQVNSKIKKQFQIEMHREEKIVYQGRRALEVSADHAQKTPKAVLKQATKMEDDTQIPKTNQGSAPKPVHQMEDETKSSKVNAPKPLHRIGENSQKARARSLELYRPPHQRRLSGRTPSSMGNGSDPAEAHTKPIKQSLPTAPEQFIKSTLPGTESYMKNYVAPELEIEALPKLTDLPSKSITSGMEADVFVSHCNNPLSFYVQFVKEEDDIFSIVEKLNDCQSTTKAIDIKDVHPGDLVQAEFPDDSSWYRAVVREIHGNTMALVEFVDYGNTAVMPISKMYRLHKPFLQLPTYSTHCMLSEAAALGKEVVLDPEVVSTFKKDIGGNGDKELKCRFIRQSGSVWEVSLEESGVNVMCNLPSKGPTEKHGQVEEKSVQSSASREMAPEKSRLNSCPLCYLKHDFVEGQKLEAYVTTINGAQSFWCQSADSEELDEMTLSVSEVGNAAHHKPVDTNCLYPGRPCIALYVEDDLWYRAEVISKDEDTLSVLFVDYGNKSQVNVRNVREMPPELVETPAQAFLCELEGFDPSHGSWDDGAIDELTELITDKLLQLTVLKVTRGEQGQIRCSVKIECEGKEINETMKAHWKSSPTENKPDAIGLSTSYKTPQLPCDSAMKETAMSDAQGDHKEEQCTNVCFGQHTELVIPCVTSEASELASSLKNSDCSECSVRSESYTDAQKEEMDQISSEYNATVESPPVTKRESLSEMVSNQVVTTVPTIVISEAEPNDELLSYCIGKDQTMLPLPDEDGEHEHDTLTLSSDTNVVETDKDFEKEAASVMDQAVGPDDLNSSPSLYENLGEAMAQDAKEIQKICNKICIEAVPQSTESAPATTDKLITQEEYCHMDEEESETVVAELESLPQALVTDNVEDNSDIMKDSEFGQLRAAEFLPIGSTCVVWSPAVKSWCKARVLKNLRDCTLVLLVDCDTEMIVNHDSVFEIVLPEPEQVSEIMQPCDNDDRTDHDRALSHTESQADPHEQGDDSEDIIASDDPVNTMATEEMAPQEEVGPKAYVDLHKTFDLISEESKQVQNASLLSSCVLPVQQFIDVCTEQEVETGDNALQEEAPCAPTHNKNNLMIEEETPAHHEDKDSALLADTEPAASEPHTDTVPSQNTDNLVGEVTCLIEEACSADVCIVLPDVAREAETVSSELPAHTTPTQNTVTEFTVMAKNIRCCLMLLFRATYK
uniref:tudor domain-containing 6 n=1 Tax=Centroberyx gerrardi TaxID=166262 RepID=UPI003AABC1A6